MWFLENGMNLIDCEEIKRKCCARSLVNSVIRREKLQMFVTTGMNEGKHR